MTDKKNGSEVNKAPGGMSKKAAVENGLSNLGNSATPTQLRDHIRHEYNIEMDLKHISTAKAKILSAARQSKPAAAKPASPASTSPKPIVRHEAPKTGKPHGTTDINLIDIETVKDLVERVGAASLKKLIDVMAR